MLTIKTEPEQIIKMTPNEQTIIDTLRELRPFETVAIQKDSKGKPDNFIVKREQKIFLTNN